MTYLLRKFNPFKWEPNRGLPSEQHSADAITGCTRTTDNTLSVWRSDTKDFSEEKVEKLIVALAVSMPQPAKIDVLWLEEDILLQVGLKVASTHVDSCYRNVISEHKDIQELDLQKLGLVSTHIVGQLADEKNLYSVGRPQLIDLVIKWLHKADTFELEDLSLKWQEVINKKLQVSKK